MYGIYVAASNTNDNSHCTKIDAFFIYFSLLTQQRYFRFRFQLLYICIYNNLKPIPKAKQYTSTFKMKLNIKPSSGSNIGAIESHRLACIIHWDIIWSRKIKNTLSHNEHSQLRADTTNARKLIKGVCESKSTHTQNFFH